MQFEIVKPEPTKKIRIKWDPSLEQDFDALTTESSMWYDKELAEAYIKQYGSIEAARKSFEIESYVEQCGGIEAVVESFESGLNP